MVEVMPVDRADVVESEFLEQRAAGPEPACVFFGFLRLVVEEVRQVFGELLADFAQRQVFFAGNEARQVRRHRADGRRNRHVVVVENDDQPFRERAGIVHRLIGHAGGHRAVADDADDVVVLAGEVARHGHAEAGGNRSRGMGGAERVVFALGAFGETRQPAALAQGADAVAAVGQDFMRIGLMPDVPDQPVGGCVEHIVQGDGKFDDAEARAQVSAGDGDRVDGFLPEFRRELRQRPGVEPAQVLRGF